MVKWFAVALMSVCLLGCVREVPAPEAFSQPVFYPCTCDYCGGPQGYDGCCVLRRPGFGEGYQP